MGRYGARKNQIDAATVASIQTVFQRSRLSRNGWQRRLLEGRVDSHNAWRSDRGQVDIFKDRRAQSPTVVNLWLLVDASGSMHGNKAESAADISATFVEAFKRIPSVKLRVWQHDFEYGETAVNLYRIFDPAHRSLDRFQTMHGNGLQGNADGFALAAIGQMALREARNGEKTLIIVISDGQPTDHAKNATNYDLLQFSHTVSEDLRRKGAQVYCVAIEKAKSYAYSMYGEENVVPFHYGDPRAWSDLARDLAAMLGRTLR